MKLSMAKWPKIFEISGRWREQVRGVSEDGCILARLRNRQFFSLAELNQAIRELVDQLNDRPMRGWGATRRALYEQVDRPALRELPPAAYEYADWKRCRVNLDYHVEIDKHFYSVPFRR